MAPTERSPLVDDNSSKGGIWQIIKLCCSYAWCNLYTIVTISTVLLLLLLLQILGAFALIVYCIRTIHCGINEKHPHYHCEKAPDVFVLGRSAAMNFLLQVHEKERSENEEALGTD